MGSLTSNPDGGISEKSAKCKPGDAEVEVLPKSELESEYSDKGIRLVDKMREKESRVRNGEAVKERTFGDLFGFENLEDIFPRR